VQLKDIQQYIQDRVPEEKVKLHQNLAIVLFDSSTPEFLEHFTAQQFARLAQSTLEFLDQKPSDDPRVRVYTPLESVDGWETGHSVIEMNLKDRPFIVDSIRILLKINNIGLHHLIHPVLTVDRDCNGRLKEIYLGQSDTYRVEAYQLILIDRLEKERAGILQDRIICVLNDVVAATDDYQAMRAKCREVRAWLTDIRSGARSATIPHHMEGLDEYIDFFDWLDKGNFIFLGYREYEIVHQDSQPAVKVREGSGLGILRRTETSRYHNPVPLDDFSAGQRERMHGPPLVLITKTNSESNVHRMARMDYISVKELDENGDFRSERRFLGLFTSQAFTTQTKNIPILRRKLKQVLEIERVRAGSHDFKQIVSIFDSIPRSELFWLDVSVLHQDIRDIMSIEKEQGVRVLKRYDPLRKGIALMVIMPRERFNSAVRQRIQDHLTRILKATHVDYHLAMVGGDETQVRFHFFFTTTVSDEEIDFRALNREVADMTRTWEDRLREELVGSGEPDLWKQSESILSILPQGYRAEVPVQEATRDIRNLLEMGDDPYRIDLHNSEVDRFPEATSFLRIYHRAGTLALNRVFPILENLGFHIIEQISYPCGLPADRGNAPVIDIFRVQDDQGRRIDTDRQGHRLEEALLEVLTGRVKNDRINQLVMKTDLRIREAGLLRTYRAYLSQLSAATSPAFITRTLLANPLCAAHLFRIFAARFDPAAEAGRTESVDKARQAFQESLKSVPTLPEDEVLRFLFRLIEATVRTNYYQDKSYVSIKVESRKLDNIPEPRPHCEIFVESPLLEAVHLRGGRVARGGLRWSDRPDDFRTEILGLMKTQMMKNALIVPVGSKGGFVLKNPPAQPELLHEHVKEQYRSFIRGLLDVTDNIIDKKIVHPAGLMIYDEPDPYLVVAADKGTATFSDFANQVSCEYGFWLGDAFASGGSYGYDHKKEGITARGAWECVRCHFWEMGLDPFHDEFTVVGIGDMSGDVFGNGMIYTDKIRLLAAFNHRHIFIDPNPDAAASYRERRRLFENPSLGWPDYDPSLISEGGGVFSRQAKSIRLTRQMKQMLDTTADELSGQELIRRILRLEVDLLWNGGVGTYVKASSERHADVGDSANDPVRIDATELRARVIGEGGNLGLTQLARIEYALAGGRLNTDAVDNSGGVDMSDHEVNIKILLQPEVRKNTLSFEERNSLLQEMTDDVIELVLRNNYSQSMCLSLAENAIRSRGYDFFPLQEYLVAEAGLKPRIEFLPGRVAREERKRNQQGYTRPELSILLAYTKMNIKQILLESTIPDEPVFQDYLFSYFPHALQERFQHGIESHPLRREIVATQLTNRLVDRLGPDLVQNISTETGRRPNDVLCGVLATYRILELDDFFESLFAITRQLQPPDFYGAVSQMTEACRGITQWLLITGSNLGDLSKLVTGYKASLKHLQENLADLLPARERKTFLKAHSRALAHGFPEPLDRHLAASTYLPSCIGVIDAAYAAEVSLDDAAQYYYRIGDYLHLGWLRDALGRIHSGDRTTSSALTGLIHDLRYFQQQLTVEFFRSRRSRDRKQVKKFLRLQPGLLSGIEATLKELKAKKQLTLADGVVITRQMFHLLRSLARTGN